MTIEETIDYYYKNNARKLHELVDLILIKLKFHNVDREDFYSLANEIFVDVVKRYNPSRDFKGFLYSCLLKKFKTEMTWRRRNKRCIKRKVVKEDNQGNKTVEIEVVSDVSLDMPISKEDEGATLSDYLSADDNTENLALENKNFYSDKVEQYLNSLSKRELRIAKLIMAGYQPAEIRGKESLTTQQYLDCIHEMKSFENTRVLRQINDVKIEEETDMPAQTSEKSKEKQYSIASLIKKIDSYTFRYDHPTQRKSGQWTPQMKGNLISDVLQNNPLPALVFAEQIIDGVVVTWNLDGKQKSTNVYEYAKDGYKVAKNIRRWNIEYQTTVKDENGNVKIFENGLPKFEKQFCDIRGKKFSDLPEELKERFMDYTFQCTQYLNCSDADIEYHICRYNEGKPMNAAQKSMGNIGTKYAGMVKEISAMPFFKDCGDYTMSEFRNGTIDRIVVEGIMASDFIDDWKKKPEEMCDFIKENATETNFDNFADMIERLGQVATEEVTNMFNSKDSFLWFGLFVRFSNAGIEDKKFIDFMAEFARSLHSEEIDGVIFDKLCIDPNTGKTRSTKDKSVVVSKMRLLEKLMWEYFNVDKEDVKDIDILTFVKENANSQATTEDIEFYSDILDDLTVEVDNNTKLLDKRNRPSLLALIGYACEKDIDLESWVKKFFAKNDRYNLNQKENYLYMVGDLQNSLKGAIA